MVREQPSWSIKMRKKERDTKNGGKFIWHFFKAKSSGKASHGGQLLNQRSLLRKDEIEIGNSQEGQTSWQSQIGIFPLALPRCGFNSSLFYCVLKIFFETPYLLMGLWFYTACEESFISACCRQARSVLETQEMSHVIWTEGLDRLCRKGGLS